MVGKPAMDTVVCRYCQASGEVTIHSEEYGVEKHDCPMCLGSGQMPVDENGRADYKRILEPIIGPRAFAQKHGKEIAERHFDGSDKGNPENHTAGQLDPPLTKENKN